LAVLFLPQNRFLVLVLPNLNRSGSNFAHTQTPNPIVVRNTLVGRLRPRSARGRLRAKPERLCLFFVRLVTQIFPIFYSDAVTSFVRVLAGLRTNYSLYSADFRKILRKFGARSTAELARFWLTSRSSHGGSDPLARTR